MRNFKILMAFFVSACAHGMHMETRMEDGARQYDTDSGELRYATARKSDYEMCLETYRGLSDAEELCEEHMRAGLPARSDQ